LSSFLKEHTGNDMQKFCGLEMMGIRREISLNVKLRANQAELEPARPGKKIVSEPSRHSEDVKCFFRLFAFGS